MSAAAPSSQPSIVDALADYTALKVRVAELESNERAYEAALGQRTYNEVAEHIAGLEKALRSSITAAKLLFQNSVSCAEQHHGLDVGLNGLPGWLRDAGRDLDAADAALTSPPEVTRG